MDTHIHSHFLSLIFLEILWILTRCLSCTCFFLCFCFLQYNPADTLTALILSADILLLAWVFLNSWILSASKKKILFYFLLTPGFPSLRGGFVGLRPAGELQLWGGGRRHGVAGHTTCRRGEDPHSNQPIALEHDRCYSLHLHGVCSLDPCRRFLSHCMCIFREKQPL